MKDRVGSHDNKPGNSRLNTSQLISRRRRSDNVIIGNDLFANLDTILSFQEALQRGPRTERTDLRKGTSRHGNTVNKKLEGERQFETICKASKEHQQRHALKKGSRLASRKRARHLQ